MSLVSYDTYQIENDPPQGLVSIVVDEENVTYDEESPIAHAKVIKFIDAPEIINDATAPELMEINLNTSLSSSHDTELSTIDTQHSMPTFDTRAICIRDRTRTFSEDSNLTLTGTMENALCVVIVLIVLGCIIYFGYKYSVYEDDQRDEYEPQQGNTSLEY